MPSNKFKIEGMMKQAIAEIVKELNK